MKDIKNKRDHQQFLGEVRTRVTKKNLRYKSVTECGAIRCKAITVNVQNYQRTGKGGTDPVSRSDKQIS
jgi:hypothetical protein